MTTTEWLSKTSWSPGIPSEPHLKVRCDPRCHSWYVWDTLKREVVGYYKNREQAEIRAGQLELCV